MAAVVTAELRRCFNRVSSFQSLAGLLQPQSLKHNRKSTAKLLPDNPVQIRFGIVKMQGCIIKGKSAVRKIFLYIFLDALFKTGLFIRFFIRCPLTGSSQTIHHFS